MGKNQNEEESENIMIKASANKAKNKNGDSLIYHLKIIFAKNKVKLSAGILTISVLIGILFIILFATVPCRFKSCNPNASCLNRPFNAKCQCNHGYSGNGIDCDECGLTYYDKTESPRTGRALPHSRPATAYILTTYTSIIESNGSNFLTWYYSSCAGVLINRKSILTTASCIKTQFNWYERSVDKNFTVDITLNKYYPTVQSIYAVYIGLVYPPAEGVDLSTMQQLYIDKIIRHDSYDSEANGYDLAVIKLKKRVSFDDYVQPVCIPDALDVQNMRSFLTVNQTAFATGWSQPFGRFGGQVLTNYEMYILNTADCSSVMRTKGDIQGVLCAGNYTNFISRIPDSYCRGSQGGGLYSTEMINGKLRDIVIGVLSYNYLCGLQIYTSLFHYVDWIADKSDY